MFLIHVDNPVPSVASWKTGGSFLHAGSQHDVHVSDLPFQTPVSLPILPGMLCPQAPRLPSAAFSLYLFLFHHDSTVPPSLPRFSPSSSLRLHKHLPCLTHLTPFQRGRLCVQVLFWQDFQIWVFFFIANSKTVFLSTDRAFDSGKSRSRCSGMGEGGRFKGFLNSRGTFLACPWETADCCPDEPSP